MMNLLSFSSRIIPKAGLRHFGETYLTWSSVGFIATLIADTLDRHAEASYAAYYTSAVNDAVGYQFWVLLSSIALLLLCVVIPLIFLVVYFDHFQIITDPLRRLAYTFFLVAFDEGALMIGILIANFIHLGDKAALLASKSYLFSDVGFFSILFLAFLNSLLWVLGEAVYNRDDRSISGIVEILISMPVKYTAPLYAAVSAGTIYMIINQ